MKTLDILYSKNDLKLLIVFVKELCNEWLEEQNLSEGDLRDYMKDKIDEIVSKQEQRVHELIICEILINTFERLKADCSEEDNESTISPEKFKTTFDEEWNIYWSKIDDEDLSKSCKLDYCGYIKEIDNVTKVWVKFKFKENCDSATLLDKNSIENSIEYYKNILVQTYIKVSQVASSHLLRDFLNFILEYKTIGKKKFELEALFQVDI